MELLEQKKSSCPKQLRLAVALPNCWRCPKLSVDALLRAREEKIGVIAERQESDGNMVLL